MNPRLTKLRTVVRRQLAKAQIDSDHAAVANLSRTLLSCEEAIAADEARDAAAAIPPDATSLDGLTIEELEQRALALADMARTLRERAQRDAPARASPVRPDDVAADIAQQMDALDATCEYCHLPLSRCAEMQATRLDSWRALHRNDPDEITRREKLATDEMFEAWRRACTGGDPWVR